MMRGSLTSYTHPATMDVKLLVLVTCLLVVLMGNQVAADFFYNPKSASTDQLEGLSLKCIPGRTVLKVKETLVPVVIDENPNSDENRRYGQTRRDHMRVVMKDESCSMCVCSTDGKHEYCSNRPAVNVNECLMMKKLMSRFEGSEPFDHERDLSFRIRRVGSDMDKKKCVPFVSQYTDCTDENICTGCTKCTCSAEGQWTCDSVQECDEEDQDDGDINERYIENALQTIETEMKTKRIKEAKATNTPLVPKPKKNFSKDLLLGYMIAVPHKRTEMHNIYI